MQSEKLKLLKSLRDRGYVFQDHDFYVVRHGKYKDLIGICVGQFTHSCHIDTTEYYVLLFSDLGDIFVKEFSENYLQKIQ